MQIQCGKLYENRTWKYLFPSLKSHGDFLLKNLSKLFKLGVGIGDSNIKIEEGNCIYILIDVKIPLSSEEEIKKYTENFAKFLDWVSYQHYYVRDYLFDNMCGSEKHMVVLRLPMLHDIAYIKFIRGKYSEMYTSKVIDKYFNLKSNPNKNIEKEINNKIKNTRSILKKDKEYIQAFCDIVNKDFNTEVTPYIYRNAELDYPPTLKDEVFNYIEE